MKFIREASDVHLDFDINTRSQRPALEMLKCWMPVPMDGDLDTCFILAGDIWTDRKFLLRKYEDGQSWMAKLAQRFKYVVFVLGNHDCWGTNLTYEHDKIKQELEAQGLTNCFILEKTSLVLDQVKFVGGTLWTDYNRCDPMILGAARGTMVKDHHYIKVGPGYSYVQPMHFYEIHMNTKKFIFNNVKRDDPDQKIVVVSHMAPTPKSIDRRFINSWRDNFYYYSDLEKRILADGQEIDLWFHGHTHAFADYNVGNVRVVCNPRGYNGYEPQSKVGYQPEFRVELP